MIKFNEDIKIWLSVNAVDMRCAIDGLLVKVTSQLKLNPQDKQLFLFYGKGKDKVKGLWWDHNGFFLIYKRLEKGRFKIPKLDGDKWEMTLTQLYGLLRGLDFMLLGEEGTLFFKHYS